MGISIGLFGWSILGMGALSYVKGNRGGKVVRDGVVQGLAVGAGITVAVVGVGATALLWAGTKLQDAVDQAQKTGEMEEENGTRTVTLYSPKSQTTTTITTGSRLRDPITVSTRSNPNLFVPSPYSGS